MHPPAGIEIRTAHRQRARVHIEPHPAMPAEMCVVSFTVSEGATSVELTLSRDSARQLTTQVDAWLFDTEQAREVSTA